MPGSFITSLIITRAALFLRPRNFYCFYPARLLSWDEYYSYILTVSNVTLGKPSLLSWGMHAVYANLCIISIFHTTRYCVKNEWIFNTPRVVNLAFRFVYISYPVAIYILCIIYAYNIVLFQCLVNDVFFDKFSIILSACLSSSNQKNKIYIYIISFSTKLSLNFWY